MGSATGIEKDCDKFLAQISERYSLGGAVLLVNVQGEQFVHAFQAGNILCNTEMCRRFVNIADAESLAQVLEKHLVAENDDEEADE